MRDKRNSIGTTLITIIKPIIPRVIPTIFLYFEA